MGCVHEDGRPRLEKKHPKKTQIPFQPLSHPRKMSSSSRSKGKGKPSPHAHPHTDEEALKLAKAALARGLKPMTASRAFVHEEMHHFKEKGESSSRQQAIAIGLSKARKYGILGPRGKKGKDWGGEGEGEGEEGTTTTRTPSRKGPKAAAQSKRAKKAAAGRSSSSSSRGRKGAGSTASKGKTKAKAKAKKRSAGAAKKA